MDRSVLGRITFQPSAALVALVRGSVRIEVRCGGRRGNPVLASAGICTLSNLTCGLTWPQEVSIFSDLLVRSAWAQWMMEAASPLTFAARVTDGT